MMIVAIKMVRSCLSVMIMGTMRMGGKDEAVVVVLVGIVVAALLPAVVTALVNE